jgi:chromosome segregation ATPase
MKTGESQLERLTEAVDRLIIRVETLQAQRDKLAAKLAEIEQGPQSGSGSVDAEGYNLLRIHSARLLRERQELGKRLGKVLEKLEKLQRKLR